VLGADVRADNAAMLTPARRLGFDIRPGAADGVLRAELTL